MRWTPKRTQCVLLLLLLGASSTSCAIVEKNNRPVLEWMDDTLAPGSSTGRVLLAPLILPIGLVGAATDAVIVRPATSFDDAYHDTADLLWDFEIESRFWKILHAPLATIASPIVYAGSFTARCLFPVDDNPIPEPNLNSTKPRVLEGPIDRSHRAAERDADPQDEGEER